MKPDNIVDWFVNWACCTWKMKREDSFHIPIGSLQWASGEKGGGHKQMRLHPWTFVTKPVSSTGRMHVRARSHIKPLK